MPLLLQCLGPKTLFWGGPWTLKIPSGLLGVEGSVDSRSFGPKVSKYRNLFGPNYVRFWTSV